MRPITPPTYAVVAAGIETETDPAKRQQQVNQFTAAFQSAPNYHAVLWTKALADAGLPNPA